jgi:hypothetical protein
MYTRLPTHQDTPNVVKWHSFNVCDSSLPIPPPAPGGWLVINAGRTGFYRVNYSVPLWEGFIEAAKDPQKISAIDLAGALDDTYTMGLVSLVAGCWVLRSWVGGWLGCLLVGPLLCGGRGQSSSAPFSVPK